MELRAFDYELPEELIAQRAAADRDASRLLVLDRSSGEIAHATFADLPQFLRRRDLLVVNDSRVFPARLLGHRVPSGGRVECLLVRCLDDGRWEALVHPGQKLRPGVRVVFTGAERALHGEILERRFFGRRTIRLWTEDGTDDAARIDAIGHIPLPPYIKRPDESADRERYQTVYARARGSVAAPTAGLHFTPELLEALETRGVERTAITLHVGYGTFKPIRSAQVEDHVMEAERFEISQAAAVGINAAIEARRRIVAVGTTTARTLETAVRSGHGRVEAGAGETQLYISPGFSFQAVGALVTNFHLPRSSLLVLVCAFAGQERVLASYREAIDRRYRFYSYGDAMLIT